MGKRKEIKFLCKDGQTREGRQDGVMFWIRKDQKREQDGLPAFYVAANDIKGKGRTIYTAGHEYFTLEGAKELCQQIMAGEANLAERKARYAAEDMEKERRAVAAATEQAKAFRDKLEQDVAAITTEQTTQGVRISAVEDDLAVYRAAVSARELKQAAAEVKAAKERRTARAAERERKARRRNKVLAFIALALFVAVCVVMVAKAYSEEPAAEPAAPEASAAPAAILPTELLFTAAAEEEYMEDPQETEKIEEALLAQGYFSLAVPMPYEWQDYMRTYCEEYGCPYPLALAVAQTESNFDMDAVGASGEVGIMQLNPGPGSSYHAEIQAATGLDPTTASGNIAGGCYKLGLYLAKYGSVEKAAMAYNMGEGGARSAWDSGITSTDYSKAVKEAMETWECTVNAWGGV